MTGEGPPGKHSRDPYDEQEIFKASYTYSGPDRARSEHKRRKVSQVSEAHDYRQATKALLNGRELIEGQGARLAVFRSFWDSQTKTIEAKLQDVNQEVKSAVSAFVRKSAVTSEGKIPTALIIAEPNSASHSKLFAALQHSLSYDDGKVVVLDSSSAPNLKALLKSIIKLAEQKPLVSQSLESPLYPLSFPGEDPIGAQRLVPGKGRRLGYDLELLQDTVRRHRFRRVVLAFKDSEGFDVGVLNELLALLRSWSDRIPFTLLFGIATSVELFQGRLARSSLCTLDGTVFELDDTIDYSSAIYQICQCNETGIWLGPNVSRLLLKEANDHMQSPEIFTNTLKYAYMAHFFANPLSSLLHLEAGQRLQIEHCEAIRCLPSFRRLAEDLLCQRNISEARMLLGDDDYLSQRCASLIAAGQLKMRKIFQNVQLIMQLHLLLATGKHPSYSEIALQALAGDNILGNYLGDISEGIRKSTSDELQHVVGLLIKEMPSLALLKNVHSKLLELAERSGRTTPVFSQYHPRNTTLQATFVSQKVKLSKAKAKLSDLERAFTTITDRFCQDLEAHFAEGLVRPEELYLSEIFVYDLRTPVRDSLGPRPRFSIEKALSLPYNYITDMSQASGRPATAVLYSMYLDTGLLINSFDFYNAFKAILQTDDPNCSEDELALALFYQAVSDVNILGMVRHSRKKIDHLAKYAWRGL